MAAWLRVEASPRLPPSETDIPELVSACLVVVTVANSTPGSGSGQRGSLCVNLAARCNLKEV